MATRWPRVHARVVSLLPDVTGWSGVTVFDGPQVTGNVPPAYVTVGFAELEDSAGSWETEPRGADWRVGEAGSVRCELVVSSGGTDMTAVRERAFALLDALSEAVETDQTLGGVLSADGTCALAVDVVPDQTTAGARLRLPFSLLYATRT